MLTRSAALLGPQLIKEFCALQLGTVGSKELFFELCHPRGARAKRSGV
jgi:hypothetical protein